EGIRQATLLLLSPTPGERLMRPDYGSRLHRLANAPNDDTTAVLAIHHVRQALRWWEPRVEALDVAAQADPDRPRRLKIQLRSLVRTSRRTEVLAYPVDL